MSWDTNTTAVTAANVTASDGVELLWSSTLSSVSNIESCYLYQQIIDSSSLQNSQYFNMRQPPPAHHHQYNQPHLKQHIITGNPKILPPTSSTVVSANVNTYFDEQHLDQHKPPSVSTSSCFSTNLFKQPSLQQQHQTNYNTDSTTANQTYSPTTTLVSSTVTSVTTKSFPIALYNQQHLINSPKQNPNNYNDLTNNIRGNYAVNDNINSLFGPRVIVPNIEEELSHLCDDSMYTSYAQVDPLKLTTQKPSFLDSYTEFLRQRTNKMISKKEDKCLEENILIRPLSSSTPKPISEPQVVVTSELTSSRDINNEDKKASNVSTISTIDDDPQYFPLPQTSFIAGINDDKNDGNLDKNSWLSTNDEQNNWWISSSKGPGSASSSAKSVIKNKVDSENKIKSSTGTLKRKRKNSVAEIKNHLPSTSPSININNTQTDNSTVEIPFKSGSFVVLKSEFQDIGLVIPQQLWRVDGKSLLQKFQRYDEKNVYKSTLIYNGWNSSHYNLYCQVAVQLVTSNNGKNIIPKKCSNSEIIVELLCKNDDKKCIQNNTIDNTKNKSTACMLQIHTSKQKVNAIDSRSSMYSTASCDENVMLRAKFNIYIQILVSHALDSNFLREIYFENNHFFLSNFCAIESVTQSFVQAINSTIKRDLGTDISKVEDLRKMITRFPNIKICSVNNMRLSCIVCGFRGSEEKQIKFVEISLSGIEYNSRTLRNIDNTTSLNIIPMKQVNCCTSRECIEKFTVLHSLIHLKYRIYKECCKRIAIDNSSNTSAQEKTTVLSQLIADNEWIEKLFQMACNTWSRATKFVPNK